MAAGLARLGHEVRLIGRPGTARLAADAVSVARAPRLRGFLGRLALLTCTADFPAFCCRSSGLSGPHRVDGPRDAARPVRAQRAIGGAGIVVAHPIPEAAALPEAEVEAAIGRALADAARPPG